LIVYNICPGVAGGDLCSSNRVDAIFNTDASDYFVFQGSKYWKLTEETVADGYPRFDESMLKHGKL
jgi:matrix metalloproteinase-14 (membrane-inserted)